MSSSVTPVPVSDWSSALDIADGNAVPSADAVMSTDVAIAPGPHPGGIAFCIDQITMLAELDRDEFSGVVEVRIPYGLVQHEAAVLFGHGAVIRSKGDL